MLKSLRKHLDLKTGAAIILVVVAGAGLWLWYRAEHSPKKVVTAGTPVSLPATVKQTPQNDKAPSSNGSSIESARNSAGVTDTGGSTPSSTNSSQWVVSSSGMITVKQPVANARLQDGDIIAGSAKLDQVNYRLKDNKVGVLTQGTLSVINGNYSGTLHFHAQGTGGQLDIFSTDSRGVEYNEVQINVSF